jgi:multidrug efflux pump subunit AcrA (membrane-fusion protein)
MKLARRLALVALVVVALGAGLVVAVPAVTPPPDVPTARPERGDVEMRVHARGEIAPHQSMALSAPPIGGQLQLVKLVLGGTLVTKDEIVMAFDPEAQRHNLAQAQSELQEAEQEIRKLRADSRVRAAEDELALVEARFEVKLAEVRVSGNEFVGTIEARKNELALEEARRKVEQIERDIETRAAGSEAALAALTEKRRKAELAIALAERNIERMTVRAPIDGMVTVNLNRGMMGFPGMVIPEFREGDTVQPGTVVASVVDLSSVEVTAKVDENARTVLTEGAVATVQVDAVPGGTLEARTRRLGSMAAQGFVWIASTPEFEASFRIERPPPELRPGMTAAVVASADVVKDVLHLPRQALFQKDGKPVVYVRRGGDFVATEVKVRQLTESRVVLEGITTNDDVALADPERAAQPAGQSTAPPAPGGA